ncbi:MAG: flagellar biosynthesis protein FlhA [Chlamydiia bacterium]|nr:flagellar biosynthesis protein FlhA [Chlamydiia bacterium]
MLGAVVGRLASIARYSDALLAVAVVAIVMLMVIPLPPSLLDGLLSISIVLAVTTLLITLYTEDALSFSSFPSLLLFLTLFRLGLNIASTRMILAQAEAGDIIKTFGEFVTGGNQLVGLVIFILLTVINFVVITKGSGRVAEVAARFTLDAMPGKQMSIDADLNAGIIDEDEAKLRREKINAEADFYGSMDGASKFVRGDAIAGIIITVVNILGGFAIGVALKGMDWLQAIDTYTVLSIGDGLVTQIPALLISVGAGIIVTRASASENLGTTFSKQLFNNPRVLFITSIIVGLLGFVPGMPKVVLAPMSVALGAYAYVLWKNTVEELEQFEAGMTESRESEAPTQQSDDVEKALFVDPMEIELGYGLIPLVDQAQGGDLLSRITVIRRQIASELGIVVPPIRIRDNMALEAEQYVIKIKGIEVAHGALFLDSYLAMNPGNAERTLTGIDTHEPAFGLPAIWISSAQKEIAEGAGYTVVDTLSVLATHLTEVIHAHAHELLNRQEASRLIDNAKAYASAVIEELIPNQLTLGQVLRVLQGLLRERIPVRDIVSVLEILADHSTTSNDPVILTEYVRQGLARSLTKQYQSEDGKVYVVTLEPRVEQMLQESVQKNDFGTRIVIRPQTVQKIVEQIHAQVDEGVANGTQPVLLVSAGIRPYFKHLIERALPRLAVLSFNEISANVEIEAIGVVSQEVLM